MKFKEPKKIKVAKLKPKRRRVSTSPTTNQVDKPKKRMVEFRHTIQGRNGNYLTQWTTLSKEEYQIFSTKRVVDSEERPLNLAE